MSLHIIELVICNFLFFQQIKVYILENVSKEKSKTKHLKKTTSFGS